MAVGHGKIVQLISLANLLTPTLPLSSSALPPSFSSLYTSASPSPSLPFPLPLKIYWPSNTHFVIKSRSLWWLESCHFSSDTLILEQPVDIPIWQHDSATWVLTSSWCYFQDVNMLDPRAAHQIKSSLVFLMDCGRISCLTLRWNRLSILSPHSWILAVQCVASSQNQRY